MYQETLKAAVLNIYGFNNIIKKFLFLYKYYIIIEEKGHDFI